MSTELKFNENCEAMQEDTGLRISTSGFRIPTILN